MTTGNLANRRLWSVTIAALIGIGGLKVLAQEPTEVRLTTPRVTLPAAPGAPIPIGPPQPENGRWRAVTTYHADGALPLGETVRYLDPKEMAAEQKREASIRDLLAQYSKSEKKESDRSKLADELVAIVTQQFDARQQSRDKELKELEEQIAELRKIHDKRSKQKDSIVRDRTQQLILESEGLGWSEKPATTRPIPGVLPTPEFRPR